MTGIYIHIPFCIRKCPYCSFTSFTPGNVPEEEYINALLKEINSRSTESNSTDIVTAYFGGGTPSLISPAGISKILSDLAKKFRLINPEITIEANPGTIDMERLRGYKDAGINRISIGIQSFNDRLLMSLGRSHSSKEALNAIESARKAGFDNIGIDLIHSIGGESLQDWKDDLKEALSLRPEHISAYNLTIEEGTPFQLSQEKGLLDLPGDEYQTEMLLDTIELLCTAGYEHYEVSNYALPGFRSKHNQLYWKGGDYFGFGVSAHSYFKKGFGIRMANSPLLNNYLSLINRNGTAVVEEDLLTREMAMGETVFLGLRMMEGINVKDFESRFRMKIEEAYKESIDEMTGGDLLTFDNGRLRLTQKGLLFHNNVSIRFV
ncbi:MAG: radical SAM family heme chaperone HemW [Nitrospirae bacterium]|nr:radical SAM family heme chaperone HemW [Nitrospirota bacterium]